MDTIQKELLEAVSGLHEIPVGAIISVQTARRRPETAQNILKSCQEKAETALSLRSNREQKMKVCIFP